MADKQAQDGAPAGPAAVAPPPAMPKEGPAKARPNVLALAAQPATALGEASPAAHPAGGMVYEVLVDQWGYDEHQCRRGDLLRAGDVPYDLAWALRLGTVREAPEYAHLLARPVAAPAAQGT
jgi:hypothetical protein